MRAYFVIKNNDGSSCIALASIQMQAKIVLGPMPHGAAIAVDLVESDIAYTVESLRRLGQEILYMISDSLKIEPGAVVFPIMLKND